MSEKAQGWSYVGILAVLLSLMMFSNFANAEGGKNRFGDDTIDEVYQLCQGIDEGTIEYEVCTGPEDGNCIVVRVDCSQDDDESEE